MRERPIETYTGFLPTQYEIPDGWKRSVGSGAHEWYNQFYEHEDGFVLCMGVAYENDESPIGILYEIELLWANSPDEFDDLVWCEHSRYASAAFDEGMRVMREVERGGFSSE